MYVFKAARETTQEHHRMQHPRGTGSYEHCRTTGSPAGRTRARVQSVHLPEAAGQERARAATAMWCLMVLMATMVLKDP